MVVIVPTAAVLQLFLEHISDSTAFSEQLYPIAIGTDEQVNQTFLTLDVVPST